jgi:CRP-like cAMP-binding protein
MERLVHSAHSVLRGIWLNPGRIETSIEHLLLRMLEPNQPNSILRQGLLEELDRRAKRKHIILEYLGLKEVGTDQGDDIVLYLVSPNVLRNHWQETLLLHQGDGPIGFVFNSWDQGRVAVVHEVFRQLSHVQKDLIRKYAALAARGMQHDRIVSMLRRDDAKPGQYEEIMHEARRRLQSLDQSVLFSHDGEIRIQLGSLSQTTKNILREGIKGEYLFILPKHLFEGRTNYADVEFMVYLNFFVRHGKRTRIAATAGQKEALERLLNLTIFGLFNPQDAEHPPFAELQRAYGVSDRELAAFFRMCYEKYSIRKGFNPAGAILGIEDYVDFVLLGDVDRRTVIPINTQDEGTQQSDTSTVQVTARPNGTFDVGITQPNGGSTTKRLGVMPPSRVMRTVPDALRQTIQFATDRPRFGVTPLGTSHGFDLAGDLTSFVIWINDRGILVDPSPEALGYLDHIGVAQSDLLYVFLTHVHADHDGGLIEKLLGGSRTTIIASDVVFRCFMEKAQLVTGHDFQQERLVEQVSANPGVPVVLEIAGERVELHTRWNLHPIPTNGFTLTIAGKSFGYSGDTQFDPDLIRQLQTEKQLSPHLADNLLYFFWTPDGQPKVDLFYHEAGIPPIHTDKRSLERLPESVKARTFLVHIADRDVPPDFRPGKPPLFVTHTLLPATDQSRQGMLLRTLRLVSYLYDIPTETLQELAHMATLRVIESGAMILHKGPMKPGEQLNFFVVAEGEVAIQDGRRLLARLFKADSFGEWGISHQRGFRTADVVASRRTQLLELDEEAYRRMVEKHPVIQERIGRIRALLPRLQLAQARAVQQSQEEPQRTRSVIEEMNANQLSAFTVFSQVKEFKQGRPVVVEGEEADGFYILLSGHLTVSTGGEAVGELSEGDVFGEVGLIEESLRTATVEVVSADAEVLFMSQQNFQTLLQTVPAFSFGIRATAARRHA